MPYVNIKVTGGKEAPTAAQKAELIGGNRIAGTRAG